MSLQKAIEDYQNDVGYLDFLIDKVEDKKDKVCEEIKIARTKKALSLAQVGKKVGVSRGFIHDIELGRRFPSEKVLAKIIKALS